MPPAAKGSDGTLEFHLEGKWVGEALEKGLLFAGSACGVRD